MVHTAIFLGAGASCAEGAPSQGRLFADYFTSAEFRKSKKKMDRELEDFFAKMFKLNVKRQDIATVSFPTFEEVLGLTDLAIMRKEAFRHFDIENRDRNSGRLRFVAQYLVFLVAKVLHAKLGDRARFHRQLVEALQMENELMNTVLSPPTTTFSSTTRSPKSGGTEYILTMESSFAISSGRTTGSGHNEATVFHCSSLTVL